MRDEYICVSVRRNNGIKQVHLVKDHPMSQPEDILWDVLSEEFVEGRRYQIYVVPIIGDGR